ncbi:MAG: 2-hydroxyacid dehydrogenase, partial [Treponema sp.]|nr:2-hydroxyacid dehydrogenase [Treponema sp.]
YFFEDWSLAPIQDDVLARLIQFPNVLLTSHQAFLTEEALGEIARVTLENVRQWVVERKTANEVCYQCTTINGKEKCTRQETGVCWS